jgi:hypothetical protein
MRHKWGRRRMRVEKSLGKRAIELQIRKYMDNIKSMLY